MTPKPKRTVFVLVRSDWIYEDGPWDGGYAPLRGYATRAEAEAAIPGPPVGESFGPAEQSYQIVEVPVEE